MKNTQEATELEHWRRFRDGDDTAIKILYDTYFEPLYNYGIKYCRNENLVRDSLQDLFLKLMRNRLSIDIPRSVKKYLFVAFKSMMIDHLRKQQLKESRYEYGPITEDFELKAIPISSIVDSGLSLDYTEKLNKALQELTPKQREIVFLLYYEEFSYDEVAKMLNMSRKAAYKLAARAIQVLKDVFVILFLTLIYNGGIAFFSLVTIEIIFNSFLFYLLRF